MVKHVDLVLDPKIRDWVLIPLVVIMFLMGVLRNNVTKMLRKDTPPSRTQILQNNQLMRARRLRANACYIPAASFYARKKFFCQKDDGILMQKHEAPNPMSMMQGAAALSPPCRAASGAAGRALASTVLPVARPPLLPSLTRPLAASLPWGSCVLACPPEVPTEITCHAQTRTS